MVVGLGVDLVDIERIEALLERWGERFERRVFTDGERAYCRARARVAQHYAARFAAKEAALKSLSAPDGASWHEMEVAFEGPQPVLRLGGVMAAAAAARGAARSLISLSHSGGYAVAVVVLETA